MIKSLTTAKTNNFLFQLIMKPIGNFQVAVQPQKETVTEKAYQILLRNNIESRIKFPSEGVLKMLRSRGITKIMAANHNINDTEQVLEAHVECLYALIHRIEPSIQAISMFTEKIYSQIDNLRQIEISSPSLINLLKPKVITKIVKITQAIDAFYNEAFRGLISALIIKLLNTSVKNEVQYSNEIKKLNEQISQIKKGSKTVVDEDGNIIQIEDLVSWQRKRLREIEESCRHLGEMDYWTGFQFVLSMEYYTEEFLMSNITRLEKSLEKDIRTLGITELMIKIKCIIELHQFKNQKQVGEKGLRSLFFSYNKMIEQYFKLLSNENQLFEIINSEEPIVQTQLLTDFLTPEHYEKAKKVYLEIFKTALNISSNGTLLLDIKRLRGFFEIFLILFTHEDTKDMHDILAQFEKIMIMYPLEKFDKLETHCYISQKFGYQSDYFAEKFFKHLLLQKQKLERNRGHLHHVHQVTREIFLAKKFLIYTKIAQKQSKQQQQLAASLINSLFDPNIWYCLNESEPVFEDFLTSSSFSHHIYFHRTGIHNITSGGIQRRRIEGIRLEMGLKNLNRQHANLLEEMRNQNNKFNLKLDHLSYWRQNPHARMKTILELANFNFLYLQKTNLQESNNFIQQFLSKSLGVTFFYNALKQRFAYPQILTSFIELMDKSNSKNFPIQTRDLQAIKRMYHAQLLKIIKSTQKPPFVHYYQDHLDMLELNRVIIPFNQEVYGLSNIGNCAVLSLSYQAMKRFEKQKEYVKIQIETYQKFNKSGDITVATNYMEFPHLGDVKIAIGDESMIVLFRGFQGEPNHFLNHKQYELQKDSQLYWKKKFYAVSIIKCEKDLQQFMKKVTRLRARTQK